MATARPHRGGLCQWGRTEPLTSVLTPAQVPEGARRKLPGRPRHPGAGSGAAGRPGADLAKAGGPQGLALLSCPLTRGHMGGVSHLLGRVTAQSGQRSRACQAPSQSNQTPGVGLPRGRRGSAHLQGHRCLWPSRPRTEKRSPGARGPLTGGRAGAPPLWVLRLLSQRPPGWKDSPAAWPWTVPDYDLTPAQRGECGAARTAGAGGLLGLGGYVKGRGCRARLVPAPTSPLPSRGWRVRSQDPAETPRD